MNDVALKNSHLAEAEAEADEQAFDKMCNEASALADAARDTLPDDRTNLTVSVLCDALRRATTIVEIRACLRELRRLGSITTIH